MGVYASADTIVATLIQQWMASRRHRNNILHENFTSSGVGVARRDFSGDFHYVGSK